ncbi:hypothetical protein [Halorussus halophilus]|uniref:hypothetical protein n=1 Tax=Halorussus halophilus TaxID=2650975 RepID=UPI0013018206|nr:hypothetical protein [Halorussus halophilus]
MRSLKDSLSMDALFLEQSEDPLYRYTATHSKTFRTLEYGLWTLAILFGLGDVLTTLVGVTPVFGGPYEGLYESVALSRWVIETVGPWGLLPKKLVMLGLVAAVWRAFPKPYRLLFVVAAVVANWLLFWGNVQLLVDVGAVAVPW